MLGYAFMGRAHAHALITLGPHDRAARDRARAWCRWRAATRRSAPSSPSASASRATWRTGQEVVADPEVEVLENLLPNHLHAEPVIAAARAGKHVVCEKPLALDAAQAREMLDAVTEAGVVHMCAFNYRFVPAVRRAREMLEAGDLGEVHHFRGTYRQSWGADPAREGVWRFDAAQAGGGALGDLASHVVDMARYLVGEIDERGRAGGHVRARPRGRRRRGGRGVVRGRRHRDDRGHALRHRRPQPLHLGDQRLQGLARLRPRAA